MFNMSTMYDWDHGIVNRNYFVLNTLLKDPSVERIISVDFFPVGFKKTAKHYIKNILLEVKNGEMIYGDLTSACFRRAQNLYVYSTIDNIFTWKTVARELKRVEKILNLNNIIFWSYNPMFTEFIGHLNEKLFVFDTVDNWLEHTSYTKLINKNKLKRKYEKIAAEADLIFTVSESMKKFYKKIDRPDHVYWMPNGVDVNHFNDPSIITSKTELDDLQGPIIGYVGTVEGRFDLDLFTAVVKLNPDKNFIVCGPIWDDIKKEWHEKTKPFKNIISTGRIKYDKLPAYINKFDVAIMPHKQNAFVESMNPMKLYEYLAAGKPIVSTPVSGTKEFESEINTANNAIEFSQHINQLLQQETIEKMTRRKNLAKQHSWQIRVDQMMSLVHTYIKKKTPN